MHLVPIALHLKNGIRLNRSALPAVHFVAIEALFDATAHHHLQAVADGRRNVKVP